MPEVSELAFAKKFEESARADFGAIARKNQIILDYELALRRMAVDLEKAKATIVVKDATVDEYKQKASDARKELTAERLRFGRERKQAFETAGNLEEELETARAKVAQLKEEAETTKRETEHMRQAHRHELKSERAGIVTEAETRFEKFKKYMDDRDKYEEKLLLHGQAVGTLRSMEVIKKWGFDVPKKLLDLLTVNEAKYKKEMEGAGVVEITAQDLSLPPPSFNQFGSNLRTVDPTTAALLRSPVLESGDHTTALDEGLVDRPELVTSGGCADGPSEVVTQGTLETKGVER